MAERSEVIRALLRRLELPPSVAGEIDWVSGVIRVNRSQAQWASYFSNPSADLALTKTLFHECQHVIQISLLTYLYRFVLQMHALVALMVDQMLDIYRELTGKGNA